MGLARETIKDAFEFMKLYPKTFAFQLIISALIFLGIFIILGSFFVSEVIFSILVNIYSLIGIGTIGLLVIIIAFLIEFSIYSLVVKNIVEEENFKIIEVLKNTLLNIPKIFLLIATLFIILLIPLLPGILVLFLTIGDLFGILTLGTLTSFPLIEVWGFILFLVGLIVTIYLSFRVWLAIPVFIIEKRGIKESIMTSFNLTKKKILEIFGVSIILVVIIFIVGVLGTLFALFGPIPNLIYNFVSGIFTGTLAGLIPPIFYFHLKKAKH